MEPVHVADIQKRNDEIIRIEITEFKGKKLLNIRTWYKTDEGEFAPTKKGIALGVEQYDELKKAVDQAGQLISNEL